MNKKISTSILALILAGLACSMPGQAAPVEDENEQADLAATITAQALTLQSPSATSEPPTETPMPESTATITLTSMPEVPMASVSVSTNCRTGPGTQFDLIGALSVGQTAEVVGKYQNGVYWIIKTPGSSGNCWLWGNYATVTGNTGNLPEYPSPPTPTPSPTPTATATPTPPAAPSNLTANKACNNAGAPPGFIYAGGNISWQDNSDNETGFNVYLGANLSGTIAANATTYPIPPLLVSVGQPIKMGVEAFNSGGKSAKIEVTFSCP